MTRVSESKFSTTEDIVCVMGLGYIGLPTAAFIAKSGYKVVGVDINPDYVSCINDGRVPFFEPDFDELLKTTVAEGSLTASTTPVEAAVFIIAVPTPFAKGHHVDDRYIMAAADSVASCLKGNELVILESTSPPGMTERLAERVLEKRPDLTLQPGASNSIYFAHCPERVLPGKIMEEMVTNDRVVGGLNPEAGKRAETLYSRFCEGSILLTDAVTAEMAKLTENSFRDVNIAFANELSIICEKIGVDVWELIELANHHPRVSILNPGPGVGGHCIAVDPWFIVSSAPEEARLIRTAREINDAKPDFVVDSVVGSVQKLGEHSPVALLGLAFKADIDDLRESPALSICEKLGQRIPRREILVVEPHIERLPGSLENLPNVALVSMEEAVELADTIVLLVDHTKFKSLTLKQLEGKEIIDTRGLLR
ncbi:UDP-N-acetyl-D-mannosamine dehydrogenase [Corynebacterium sp. P5848]|uniref:UDP-N-acetyl-D-mannosamine dehydrogenase n=1 Tax=Corynebacterium marambiense TaxID=2765364 RepID=UPI002260EB46|nr:UDP-N-acetyl-D-mannosamine dehydrogenase [Corynebacterium marambiense]MCX7542896.1 UDP-N-acetyl-D-mannosamine dehydrogenase [Corynebacterium marambiense]